MGFFRPILITILGSKTIQISDISADILCIIFECGYQICVRKM